jgi:hypothetical protein
MSKDTIQYTDSQAHNSIVRMQSCSIKTLSQQCLYMYGIEWLEQAHLGLCDFFEKDAVFSEQHQLTNASLKKFGQLTSAIQKMVSWLRNDESACGTCHECKSSHYRKDITASDSMDLLSYYEHQNKYRTAVKNSPSSVRNKSRHWTTEGDF